MRRSAPRPEGFPSRLQAVVDRYGSIQATADVTGQAPKTISEWLRGVRIPHTSTIIKFCEQAGVLPNWLLHGTDDPDDGVIASKAPSQSAGTKVRSMDSRESVITVAPAWLEWRFGVRPGERVGIIHATIEDAIPGEIDPEEPVLFLLDDVDGMPRREGNVGEIVLLEEYDGIGQYNGKMRIFKIAENGYVPGYIWGTALWTGKTLSRRTPKPKKNG